MSNAQVSIVAPLLGLLSHPLAGIVLKRTTPEQITLPMIASLLEQAGLVSDANLLSTIHDAVHEYASGYKNMNDMLTDPDFLARMEDMLEKHHAGTVPTDADKVVYLCSHCSQPNLI